MREALTKVLEAEPGGVTSLDEIWDVFQLNHSFTMACPIYDRLDGILGFASGGWNSFFISRV
jgi:hypothetical protein